MLSLLKNETAHPDLHSLENFGSVGAIIAPTAPADLLIVCDDGATLAIKYWQPKDLLHAIRQREFEATLIELKAQSPWTYLIIGGVMTPNADGKVRSPDGAITGWDWSAVQGALATAQELGVVVIHLQHAQQVAGQVERLAQRKRGDVRTAPLREGLFCSPAEQILLALPGIGEEKAAALLDYCGGNIAAVLHALTDPSVSAPGIGPKTRDAVRAALGLAPHAFIRYDTMTPDGARCAA